MVDVTSCFCNVMAFSFPFSLEGECSLNQSLFFTVQIAKLKLIICQR